ncbi:MAG: hypothetical protein RMN25_00500 [Anaerolineae bacterium]|nr:hypothetical protein [Thermoflexales bacterium]MDW8406234.1 hypothetical protein [Anaerolineae bacterium]
MSAQSSGSNDNLLAGLTYVIPIVGIIILVSESMKNNPYLRRHAVQSIALGIVLFVISFIIGLIPVIGCFTPILWLAVTIYYAIQAYNAKEFTIPVVTDFCKNQNWI